MPKEPEVPPLPRAYLQRVRVIGTISALVGCIYGYFAFDIWRNRNLPIVTGNVISITNRSRFFIQSVSEIIIEIQPSGQHLTVVKSRDTARRLPGTLAFRFGGDPRQKIFFPGHEPHPFWVAIMFWGLGAFLIGCHHILIDKRKPPASMVIQQK